MAQSFHRWTPSARIETVLEKPLYNAPSGYSYTVVEVGHQLYQVESMGAAGGKAVHQLRRRMDYVMGSGAVGQSYFTEENGRLFQLPLTWYRERGWDFSPGYEKNNGRFDRLMPDRCIACHSSYPRALPHLEGKYADLPPGIGCERCHGPGALHVAERTAAIRPDSGVDRTIVNPARLSLQRRVDVCEQCHVHTSVAVLREGKDAFSFLPSQLLRDQYAFFRVSGSIDIVSHADRLKQSKCFIATRTSARPLECATCHNPHAPPPDARTRNQPCLSCHTTAALAQRLTRSPAVAAHAPAADCVSCHMPREQERAVHGSFTEHWIRIPEAGAARAAPTPYADGPIEPYFERDKRGPDAKVYQGMGEIVYATLAGNHQVLGDGVAALDSALGGQTSRANAHFLLGVANQQLGLTEESIRALEQSVRADSNRPEVLRALAQAYSRTARAPAEINRLYERALAMQPALAWIRAEYAGFLEEQGRRDEAKTAYRRALDEQPSLAVAWFDLGAIFAEEGRTSESSSAFKKAVELDPLLAQGLSPLIRIGTTGKVVTSVKSLAVLPVRAQDSRAPHVAVDASGTPAVLFLGVPARGFVQVLTADGTPLRSLPSGAGGTVRWDVLSETGNPIPGGLYRAIVKGYDASGRAAAPQSFYFGVVRQRSG
ncbi:MAG: tetratricopeptide repeat protein [bacterium]